MNKLILKGRLTKDPEIRYTQNGSSVATINIATSRYNSKEQKNDTDYHRCTAFGKVAETLERFFSKGSEILIEGSLKSGSYQDKEGKTVYTYDVWIEKVEFCGSKDSSSSNNYNPTVPEGIDDEVPFN